MNSINFELLRSKWPELAELGGFAESYVYNDPASALLKLRTFAENLTKDIYRDLGLPLLNRASQLDHLENDVFKQVTPKVILHKLHLIRIQGNKGVHGERVNSETALKLLSEAFDLSRWIYVHSGLGELNDIPDYKAPLENPTGKSKEELKKEKKKVLEQLAVQESKMRLLLEELEEARKTVSVAELKPEELPKLASSTEESVNQLNFSEAETRTRLIDTALAEAAWKVGKGEDSTQEVGKEIEVPNQPTTSGIGYADYVLWDDDGKPLAVIEAKKTSELVEKGRQQAKLYADGLESKYGQRPVIFYTNGHEIWIWDDAQNYPPRIIYGFYSKDSLQYLLFQRGEKQKLNTHEASEKILKDKRFYQIEAVRAVSERFSDSHRKALIVHATGTGKTRVAIAIVELLIRAGWAKRILFLCDRKELRKQAKNAFSDFLPEPIRIVNSRIERNPSDRIFLATYPAMKPIYQSFDVGFFDLIIADESHRSIYNVYSDIFSYFDCLQIGLTATPKEHITSNTFKIFNCENGVPTAYYGLEEGVRDGYLNPYEVFEHTTEFLREGISLDVLTPEQIQELEDQGEDPTNYDYSSEEIDKIIYNRDTNRAILRNLMENGLRDESGQTLGKTIIFARNHIHAVLLMKLFDEMFPQYGGKFCQVIDNYDPRAEQLIDDFKGQGGNDDLTIAISVDMLDTGIDIPEILNLDFAKPIKSPVKFQQMIGRGTRLCENLFGPGMHKSVFRIFDHWGNFERFDSGYTPAEPTRNISLLEQVFESRLILAETALDKQHTFAFDLATDLLHADINALKNLPSIQVRDHWRTIHTFSDKVALKSFAPTTVFTLRDEIVPLMQWRDIRGFYDAYSLDLLFAKMQTCLLQGGGNINDLKIKLLDWLGQLIITITQVRENIEIIKRVQTEEFWQNLSVEELEAVRDPLRQIIHHRNVPAMNYAQPREVDITEVQEQEQYFQRLSSFSAVDQKIYEQAVEKELKQLLETDPTLQKIWARKSVTEADIDRLASLVLVQSSNVSQDYLKEFFNGKTVEELVFSIRYIVGMDPNLISKHFAEFVLKHPDLTAKQTRFLGLLKSHLALHGSITIDKLYEQPFTVLDSEGLDGIFGELEIEELIQSIIPFQPPVFDNINP